MTKRSVLKNGALGCSLILVLQFLTYLVFSGRAVVDTFAELSPATSLCPAVCCSRDIQGEFRAQHRSRLEHLLRSKYESVYASASDIPDSAWIYDGEGYLEQLRGVCLVHWNTSDSGPFWFRATFSSWHGPGSRMALDETYVWALFKWVRVKSIPTLWDSQVVAQLLLEADGVRQAHARQEAPALARRSLTMRWADWAGL